MARVQQGNHVLGLTLGLTAGKRIFRTGQNPVEGVVVFGRDRIVLVVVATGTTDGQAEEGLAEIIDHLLVGQVHVFVDIVTKSPRDSQIARGDDSLGSVLVPGDLMANHRVKGHIAIHRVEDPVAIPPSVDNWPIGVFPCGVGVADHIEPMPPPLDPIVARGEHRIDLLAESILGDGHRWFGCYRGALRAGMS